jgi:hypothetical protein
MQNFDPEHIQCGDKGSQTNLISCLTSYMVDPLHQEK